MLFLWFMIQFSTLLHGSFGESSNIVHLTRQELQNMGTNATVLDQDPKNDFIVKLHFIMDEKAVVPYLRDLIYQDYELYHITTADLIDLSNIENIDLNYSMDILQKLNKSDAASVDNFRYLLEITNMTFNDFFEKLKSNTTNLNGTPLVEALQILNVDPNKFSAALTFGIQDDVYEVLKNGTFTEEKFQSAAEKVGTDLSTFFKNARKIILDQVKTHPISFYVEKLKNNPIFDRKLYDDIWKVLQPNMTDVYRVVNLRGIIDTVYNRLNENITLGVVTSEHEIMMHKKIYFRMEALKDVINVYAESALFPGKIYDNLTIIKTTATNFVKLWSNDSILPKIEIEKEISDNNMKNCSYIFMKNTTLVEDHVKILNISQDSAIVEAGNVSEFSIGNPLICSGKLVGLASTNKDNKNLFAFDTFYQKSEINPITSGFQSTRSMFSMTHAILLWVVLVLVSQ